MRTLAVYSMKGGVGKTATAVNLAWFAQSEGLRTLLIDIDPQGASSFYFRVQSKKKAWDGRFFKAYEHLVGYIKTTQYPFLDVLPAHLSFRNFDLDLASYAKPHKRLAKILKGFNKQYDLVILDCPPAIGLTTEAIFQAADKLLVPVIPTTLSERTLTQLEAFFEAENIPKNKIIPFVSMYQAQKRLHNTTCVRLFSEHQGFASVKIPFSADIEKMGEHQAALGEFATGKSSFYRFRQLYAETKAQLGLSSLNP